VSRPAPQPPPPPSGIRGHMSWIWRFWRPHRPIMVILALFTLVSTGVVVAYPLVFRWVIDRLAAAAGAGSEGERVGGILVVLGLIAFGKVLIGFYPATRAFMNQRLDRDIREHVFAFLMKKDYRFNNAFRTGDVVTRLTDDIYEFPKIAWFSCSGVFRAVESSSKLIFCLTAMLTLNWKLTLVSILPLPVMMWLFYKLRHRIRRYVERTQESISKTNDLLEAAFSGIRIVKAFRAEEGQKKRLAEIMSERRGIFLDLMRIQSVLWSLDTLASRVGQMIVIAAGGFMVMNGEMTLGTLFAFYVFLDMLAHPMMDLPHLLVAGQQAFVSIDRVEEIRSFPVSIARDGVETVGAIASVSFERVSFGFDESRKVLDGVSFSIPRGQTVAVVGPVGCGKSTLLKLLSGILVPDEGAVRVNSRDLGELDWRSYTRRIGYVPQEGALFSKSIGENVLFGRGRPEGFEADRGDGGKGGGGSGGPDDGDRAWASRCLAVAQLDVDLETPAHGIGTEVGQRGELVSGGQKQRIAIARALAGRPDLLLLDDCTSALDAHNEDRFWSDLRELGECTAFIVSHRLATIRRADRILVLDGGRIVDQGTHEELAGRCDAYRRFLQTETRKEHLASA